MKLNPMSAGPAAALALGVLLPKSLHRRRLLTFALAGAAYGVALRQDSGALQVVTIRGVPVPNADQGLVDSGISAVGFGLLAIPAVGLARWLPLGRLPAAVALAAGYVALEANNISVLALLPGGKPKHSAS